MRKEKFRSRSLLVSFFFFFFFDSDGDRSKQFFAAYAKLVPQTTVYVDSVRGDDTTGNGTALNPLATMYAHRSANMRGGDC